MTDRSNATNDLLTGDDFLASLDDGREVWFDGERVKRITSHPAFRNSARSIARLYDALHDPDLEDDLTLVDKFGQTTHKFFAPSYSAQELVRARDAIAIWQRLCYGWMGRTPDYKASFMAQLAEGYSFYDAYGENALQWYKKCASRCLFINHVLIDPPVDRHRARIDVRDVYLSVDRDDDQGIYVSGAKMVATGSALTHATFVAVNSGTAARMEAGRDEDMALVFLVDMNAPGLKLIARPSYEFQAASPFDAPLASRFDENDAVMVFENAFIPWENVLVYRDVDKSKGFYAQSGFFNRYNLHSAVRLSIKLEFCIGLLMKGTDAAGTSRFRGVQAAIGELIGMRDLIWSLTTAMVYDPETGIGGTVVPGLQTAAASRIYTTRVWHRVRDIFESVLAGAPIYTVSSVRDMHAPDLQAVIERYYRGTGLTAPERVKLFKLVWDALYSEFAGRHSLYERNYAGNQEQHFLDALHWSEERGDAERYHALVDRCLDDYDLDGWTADYLKVNSSYPDD
ncbi:MAG: 4-hydroxyphenylacetate 3-hydroxylase N-terminal domain-containing protein [Candidatus Promineifilaceae bacterium]|nr:4-hydroxyphenylacetate 3-hydroxylase N-terminal domain-containing protein [Candidatus Promineifilaceae bacterium]